MITMSNIRGILLALFVFSVCDCECRSNSSASFWHSISQLISANQDKWSNAANRIADINVELSHNSSYCYRAIENVLRSGLEQEWSAKLISSNSFSDSGLVSSLISEEFTSLGDYQDCLSAEAHSQQPSFVGKYCMVSLETPDITSTNYSTNATVAYFHKVARKWLQIRNRFPLIRGVCVPSLCEEHELKQLIREYFTEYLNEIGVSVGYCQTKNDTKSNFGYILSITILLFFLLVGIVSTVLPTLLQRINVNTNQDLTKLIQCFHLGDNFKSLFRVKSANRSSERLDLSFIHGIKAILIFVTVISHCFVYIPSNYLSPIALFSKYPTFYLELKSLFLVNLIERGAFLIDFFFIISGFLVAHLALSFAKKLPPFSFYVFIRWIRFVPSVLAIFCITIAFQKLGSGPLFHEQLTDPFVKPCYAYWWTHFLFINNFWRVDQMCGGNLWFIAADFQLYIILYFILLLYFRKPLCAYIVAVVLALSASLAILPMLAWKMTGIPHADFPIRFNAPLPWESMRLVYTSPQFRIYPYLAGFALAVHLLRSRPKATKSSCSDLRLLVLFGLIMVCILSPIPQSLHTDQSANTNLSYGAVFMLFYVFNTIFGTMTLHELTFAEGDTSWIKRTLSSHFLVPLSRLSLGIYLLNPLLIWFNVSQNAHTPTLSVFYNFQFSCSIYLQSILLSIVVFLLFEAPFNNVIRLIIKREDVKSGGSSSATKNGHNRVESTTLMNR